MGNFQLNTYSDKKWSLLKDISYIRKTDMFRTLSIQIFFLIIGLCQAQYDYDYGVDYDTGDYANPIEEIMNKMKFGGETHIGFKEGDTIINECFIENISPEEFTQIGQLMWKKGGSNEYIGIGSTLMAPGSKYNLETYDGPEKIGATLTINSVSKEDAGEYSCSLSLRDYTGGIKFILNEEKEILDVMEEALTRPDTYFSIFNLFLQAVM